MRAIALLTAMVVAIPPAADPALRAPVPADPRAIATVDTALRRMGGAPALRKLERARYEMMTQWQRVSFDDRPYSDRPSYEQHSDVRDYVRNAWRNTRRSSPSPGQTREITDIVTDSVAIRRAGGTWAPLSVAYVDERREVFAFAPERVLLHARGAADLRSLADTVIGGARYARVAATIEQFPATLLFRRGDGLLAAAQFRAAQPNDFGLVPWGVMDVAIWYSSWSRFPGGVTLPRQADVVRVGRPYKRVTMLSAAFDTVATADSFAVSDSLRAAFLAGPASRAMHDIGLDSAAIVGERFAHFAPFAYPAGAVKLGTRWVVLEAGQAPLNAERAQEWLARTGGGDGVEAVIVTAPSPANGGAVWHASKRIPLLVAPGAVPFIGTMLRNHDQPAARATAVARARWLRNGADSLWLEPIDLPDAPGSLLVYSPSLRWVYSSAAFAPLPAEYVVERVRAHGWPVEQFGSSQRIAAPLPPSLQRPARPQANSR